MGTANIARKNTRAMALSPQAELVAVASRDLDRCTAWVDSNGHRPAGTVACYGSYAELLADSNVQAVYIPLPTTLHLEWVLKAAAAKKHVLVEKPVGVTLADAQAMVAACADHGVLFMDGVMFMHHERLARIEAELGLGPRAQPPSFWGGVTRVTAAFSFPADSAFLAGGNIRARADGDPLGCLGDLGLYW